MIKLEVMNSKELKISNTTNLSDNLKGLIDSLGISWATDLIWHHQFYKVLDSKKEQYWYFERDPKSSERVIITCKMHLSSEHLFKKMQNILEVTVESYPFPVEGFGILYKDNTYNLL